MDLTTSLEILFSGRKNVGNSVRVGVCVQVSLTIPFCVLLDLQRWSFKLVDSWICCAPVTQPHHIVWLMHFNGKIFLPFIGVFVFN